MKNRTQPKYAYVPPSSSSSTSSLSGVTASSAAPRRTQQPKYAYTPPSSSAATYSASAGEGERKVIQFYAARDKTYGCFANFARYPIRLKDKEWPTTEHYFQAMKFEGTSLEDDIRQAASPGDAKKLAQMHKATRKSNWDQVKDGVMRECLRAKFTQHKNIQQTLLKTGDALLVEHTHRDSYWGDGGDGTGKNVLGTLLMEIRDELRKPA